MNTQTKLLQLSTKLNDLQHHLLNPDHPSDAFKKLQTLPKEDLEDFCEELNLAIQKATQTGQIDEVKETLKIWKETANKLNQSAHNKKVAVLKK